MRNAFTVNLLAVVAVIRNRLPLYCSILFLLTVSESALAWTEQDIVGDWVGDGGLTLLSFGDDHKCDFRDGVEFYSGSGSYFRINDNLKLIINGNTSILEVVRASKTRLELRVTSTAESLSFERQQETEKLNRESVDELRSLEPFKIGMSATEIFAILKNKNMQIQEPEIRNIGDQIVDVSKYRLYDISGYSGQAVIASRLVLYDRDVNHFVIDFFSPPNLKLKTDTRFNLAIRIQKFKAIADDVPPIDQVQKHYVDKIGRPWSQSSDSAVWYTTQKGESPSMVERMISKDCDSFEPNADKSNNVRNIGNEAVEYASLGIVQRLNEFCGIGISTKLTKHGSLMMLLKGGVFGINPADIVTTIVDYDLIKRLTLAFIRASQENQANQAK